jgi:hypothetical protein
VIVRLRRRRRRAQQDPNKLQREATAETAEDRAATRAAMEGLDSAVEQAMLHKAKLEAVREEVRSHPPFKGSYAVHGFAYREERVGSFLSVLVVVAFRWWCT